PHRPPYRCSLVPYTTLFRSAQGLAARLVGTFGGLVPEAMVHPVVFFGYAAQEQYRLAQHHFGDRAGIGEWRVEHRHAAQHGRFEDRKSTRLNSSHVKISYAV